MNRLASISFTRETARVPENLHYYQNVKSLSHFYHKIRSNAGVEERIFVKRALAGKLDFVLDRLSQKIYQTIFRAL